MSWMIRICPFDRAAYAFGAALLMLAPTALRAQESSGLDVTMRMVVDDEELSGRVVQELQLPEPSRLRDGEAEPGSAGRERSAEAREQGRALGREISQEARSNRSDLRRGGPEKGLGLPSVDRPEKGNERPEVGQPPGLNGLPETGQRPKGDARPEVGGPK